MQLRVLSLREVQLKKRQILQKYFLECRSKSIEINDLKLRLAEDISGHSPLSKQMQNFPVIYLSD